MNDKLTIQNIWLNRKKTEAVFLKEGEAVFVLFQRGRGNITLLDDEIFMEEKEYAMIQQTGVINIRTEYPESLFVVFTGFEIPEKIMRGNLKVQSEKIMELIRKELKEKNYGYAMNCENLVNMLFVLLQRERNAQDEEKMSNEIRKKNCEKVNRYVQKHYLDSPQMEFLAKKFGYSGNTQMLRRDFLRFFGRTPTEIIKTKRIEEAKRLLETTNEGNKEIAEKLGYNSDSYFGMDFKKSTGMTPAAYRKKKKKEKIEKIMKGDYQMELKDYLA